MLIHIRRNFCIDEGHCGNQRNQSRPQANPSAPGQAARRIADEAARSHNRHIGKLGIHMLDMVALRPRGGKDRGVGNGGGMISDHRAGENGRHGKRHREHVPRPHEGDGNGNEDAESPPGIADGKAKPDGHEEKDGRQQGSHRRIHCHHLPHKAPEVQILLAANAGECPGQAA